MYFYVSSQGALIVNKDCITEKEYEELINLIKQKQKKICLM